MTESGAHSQSKDAPRSTSNLTSDEEEQGIAAEIDAIVQEASEISEGTPTEDITSSPSLLFDLSLLETISLGLLVRRLHSHQTLDTLPRRPNHVRFPNLTHTGQTVSAYNHSPQPLHRRNFSSLKSFLLSVKGL